MNTRRSFLKKGLAGFFGASALSAAREAGAAAAHSFKLKYAPNLGLMGQIQDPVDRLDAYADFGFKAFEFNGLMGWSTERAGLLRKRMDELGLQMGVFVANPSGWDKTGMVDPGQRPAFLEEITRAMTYAGITGNKWLTAITGMAIPGVYRGVQRANVVESLRRAADIVEKHGVTLVIEPLNQPVDHAGYFLARSDEAYEVMKAVDSPFIKILFDIYHQQIEEGNLINNIRAYYDEIGYFQLADVPGRHEPGTGEINYRNVFRAIHGLKFEGILGLELSPSVKQEPEGSLAVFNSIVEADKF
ncbi:MAG: TIM barrel protein [Candidatus Glassbacteria bacterium]|nr:TIM barrel protein [Candidatus Glassbacteria bacterium]